MHMNIPERIKLHNQNRVPEFRNMKYNKMIQDTFRFYRGSCHLFYEDFPTESTLNSSPKAWICGDCHLENFGSYRGDNRLVYFDINDFDESMLAPCLWELSRFMVSALIAADQLSIDYNKSKLLYNKILNVYSKTLATAHPRMVERKTAKGLVRDFLQKLKKRNKKEFINKRIEKIGNKIKLGIIQEKTAPISLETKNKIIRLVQEWFDRRGGESNKVLDVAYRIAGTGSVGLERYIILIDHNNYEEINFLDMKIASVSSLSPYLKIKQPEWKNEAERIISVQKRMQFISPALLSSIEMDGKWFLLKELQSYDDKMDLTLCKGKVNLLEEVLHTFVELIAWSQIRSSGRQSSAIADELIDFSNQNEWKKAIEDYVFTYAVKVKNDYKEFLEAHKSGFFKL